MAKVMICDDAAFMRMMIKDILTKNGYEIAAEAENGAIAVNNIRNTEYRHILCNDADTSGIACLKIFCHIVWHIIHFFCSF